MDTHGVHMNGTTTDVDKADADVARRLGFVASSTAKHPDQADLVAPGGHR